MQITDEALSLPLGIPPLVDFREKVLKEDQQEAIFIRGSRKSFVNPLLTYSKAQHHKFQNVEDKEKS